MAASEHRIEIDGHEVAYRAAPAGGDGAPILWLHGVPQHGGMWDPWLERGGGIAPDLPGFGRSGKRADFPYSIEGYAGFLNAFCDRVGLERVRLVVHDWGAVGLAMAARRPQRVERIVAIAPVPFVPGFRWHWIARIWRRRLAGELAMGLSVPALARRVARGMPRDEIDSALAHFDHGTQRAILRLYRSADPAKLAREGARLAAVEAPALVLWGDGDPFLPARHAEPLAEALGDARVELASGCGHWAWADDPSVIDSAFRFLSG